MSKVEEIFSAGIDIGTSTTSIVISKLKIKNIASGFVVPMIEIVEKEIIYRSDVYFTPLLDEKTIDFPQIEEIIRQEYNLAGIDPTQIETGAVIITGDTARKENAESVVQAVSRMAGSFVVATAGPHLEAYIAGLGSGAAEFSANKHATVANVDVGGGTTNIAIFKDGKLVNTICADIGGRLIRFKPASLTVESFISGGKITAQHLALPLEENKTMLQENLYRIGDALAQALVSMVQGNPNKLAVELAIGEMKEQKGIEYVTFSGGVGRLFYDKENTAAHLMEYGDLGPTVAMFLQKYLKVTGVKVIEPGETMYATVIGAGVHTTELSGSTIYISDAQALPLRDVPGIRLDVEDQDYAKITQNMVAKVDTFITPESDTLPAILVPEVLGESFREIKNTADALTAGIKELNRRGPLVVICEADIGKVMGNLLKNNLDDTPVISIDQINMKEGDYIDIGKPLYDGGVVPVVIKTLVWG